MLTVLVLTADRANTRAVHRKGHQCLAPTNGDSVPLFIQRPYSAIAGAVGGRRLCGGFSRKAKGFSVIAGRAAAKTAGLSLQSHHGQWARSRLITAWL
jgi:hypothetical protein